jgi:gp16 family phage-associated protein
MQTVFRASHRTTNSTNPHSMKQTKATPPLKTPEQVRADFARLGISVAEWARRNQVNPQLVREILTPRESRARRKCARGQSHRVAVLLGLKHGEIAATPDAVNVQQLKTAA